MGQNDDQGAEQGKARNERVGTFESTTDLLDKARGTDQDTSDGSTETLGHA